MLTHYDVLSVDPTAEFETIQRAWRVKVRLLHPDRHRDSPSDVQAEAAKETLRVNAAWDTLRDPQKRRDYDVYLLARHGLERTQGSSGEPDDSTPDERDAPSEWLSSQNYLTIASILIVVVACGLVMAGAVLLAHLTQ
jgi:curved DNA-binding protein CbpA